MTSNVRQSGELCENIERVSHETDAFLSLERLRFEVLIDDGPMCFSNPNPI